jgi:DNA-binding NtrC family response regulator
VETFAYRSKRLAAPASVHPKTDLRATMSHHIPLILVVIEAPRLRRLTARALAHAGYEVIEAASAWEARLVTARPDDHIDLVVCDERLTDGEGAALVTAIRAAHGEVRCVYLSDAADPPDTRAGGSPSVDALATTLETPVPGAALLEAVRAALAADARQ